jgi:alpha-D-xyloside xylohydrolase
MAAAAKRRRTALLGLACGTTLALGGASRAQEAAFPAAPVAGVSVSAAPFGIVFREGGRTLTSLAGESLRFRLRDGSERALVRLVGGRSGAVGAVYTLASAEGDLQATLRVSRTARGIRLELSPARARGVAGVFAELAASPEEHFLGSGQRARRVDLRRSVVPLKVWNICTSNQPAPFAASSAGWGLYLDTSAVGRMAFPLAVDDASFACDLGTPPCSVGPPTHAVRICLKEPRLRLELYAGEPAQVVGAYTARVGRPRAPWLPQLALVKWRDEVESSAELLEDVAELKARRLPVGWVILDNPWERLCFGSLQVDETRHPDLRSTIAALKRDGVRLMLWISPQIARRNGCPEAVWPEGFTRGDDEYALVDLTLPAARAELVRRLKRLVALGVEGFKGDRGDEVDLERHPLAGGGPLLHNRFPLLFQEAAVEAISASGGERFAAIFRAAGPGSSRIVPGFFGADRHHSWDGLEDAVRMAQTAGVGGNPVWGLDVGGYRGGELTPELFVRWAQFGALTPLFQVGGAGANARFWELGEATVERFRAAATLHYELVPYLFQLAREASWTGLPVVRPLGLGWPADERAWEAQLQFTVGEALLAAPVTAPAATGEAPARSSVYLPAGGWVDLFAGSRASGPRSRSRASTLHDFPLYVRAGAALPYNARLDVWAKPWRPDDLLRGDRQGWLAAPRAGASTATSSQGATLAVHAGERSVEVELRRGTREQQLLVLAEHPVCAVRAGAVELPRARSAAELRARPRGWLVEPAPRRAVVIKAETARGSLALRLDACGRS